MSNVAIIENTGANFTSLLYAFERLGIEAIVTSEITAIKNATHVILPGVGSANFAMQNFGKLSVLIQGLKQPVLGICLGMQLLGEYSEEGAVSCLGIIPGRIKKISAPDLIVPHMGWHNLDIVRSDSILDGVIEEDFYFVHSYALDVGEWTLARCDYGGTWSAIVKKDNFYGVQFHPEKSGAAGMQLLKNFLEK